jgi:hypothetical protein
LSFITPDKWISKDFGMEVGLSAFSVPKVTLGNPRHFNWLADQKIITH